MVCIFGTNLSKVLLYHWSRPREQCGSHTATLICHTHLSHSFFTLIFHTYLSHSFVTLICHTQLSHSFVTLICHTHLSHSFVTLICHTHLSHSFVTLICHCGNFFHCHTRSEVSTCSVAMLTLRVIIATLCSCGTLWWVVVSSV